jgi:hypothetical protein
MKKRDVTIIAGLFAALVFSQAPAAAQSVDLSGITGGNSSVSSGDTGGTTATASTSGGSALGSSGATTANVSLGGGGTGPVTGLATIGSGTTSGNPNGSVVIGTGSTPAGAGNTATVSLNPDGTVAVTTGTGTTDASGSTGAAGGALSEPEIRTALANLDDNDLAALKQKCRDVLANPGAFDAATVAICNTLASL